MSLNISPNHPKCNLFFLVQGGFREDVANAFEPLLGFLARRRTWVIGPPELVDYIDEDREGLNGDHVVHTYGCVLRIYSAFPPWDQRLPKEVDRQHYEEVTFLVNELARFSSALKCEFAGQLDNTQIGYIRNGDTDTFLQQGLLDEWRLAVSCVGPSSIDNPTGGGQNTAE